MHLHTIYKASESAPAFARQRIQMNAARIFCGCCSVTIQAVRSCACLVFTPAFTPKLLDIFLFPGDVVFGKSSKYVYVVVTKSAVCLLRVGDTVTEFR